MQNLEQRNIQVDQLKTEGVAVLGSTGSIGRSTLEVINSQAGFGLKTRGLSANGSWQLLAQQAIANKVSRVAVTDESVLPALREALAGTGIEVLGGQDGLIKVVQAEDTHRVITGIVGRAGLDQRFVCFQTAPESSLHRARRKSSLRYGSVCPSTMLKPLVRSLR